MLVAIDCEKTPDADFAVAAENIGIAFLRTIVVEI
jgi:hypothetical protein